MLYHSCEGPREEGHSCSWTSSEHGEQGEHGIQTWVFSIQQLVVFVLTLGACGQQPVRRVFETHWGILCFYLFSTEGERF